MNPVRGTIIRTWAHPNCALLTYLWYKCKQNTCCLVLQITDSAIGICSSSFNVTQLELDFDRICSVQKLFPLMPVNE